MTCFITTMNTLLFKTHTHRPASPKFSREQQTWIHPPLKIVPNKNATSCCLNKVLIKNHNAQVNITLILYLKCCCFVFFKSSLLLRLPKMAAVPSPALL